MYAAKITHHANSRMKTRCGTSGTASQKLAGIALTYGATRADANGQFHRYLTKVYHKGMSSTRSIHDIRAYGDKLYIFDEDVLVTVLQLPSQFIPKVKKITEAKKKGEIQ